MRRAGTFQNRSLTSITVPGDIAAGRTAVRWSPLCSTTAPPSAACVRLLRANRLTLAIDASASPRKPSVSIAARSWAVASLLVACAVSASSSSSSAMPQPSSAMRISLTPPSSTTMSIRVAPASMQFSISSFTTDAGRSITSPAAIWFTR